MCNWDAAQCAAEVFRLNAPFVRIEIAANALPIDFDAAFAAFALGDTCVVDHVVVGHNPAVVLAKCDIREKQAVKPFVFAREFVAPGELERSVIRRLDDV